jgi:microsomal dipeptidase-like Zn-dependent dipeptidase
VTRRAAAARIAIGAAGVAAFGAAAAAGVAAGLRVAPAVVERRYNVVHRGVPVRVSDRARELHRTMFVADLHADSLLWGRDLGTRSTLGHVDVPRLIEGGVALEGFAATTQMPRHANLERNDARRDDVVLLALIQRWPRRTWRSRLERALVLADRARRLASASGGRFGMIERRTDLETYVQRRATDRAITAGFLAIEGAHALDREPANLDVLADAGYRMLGLAHFFDTTFAGSAHGIDRIGLTGPGRELVARAEARGMLVDLAHASPATIDDTLAIARRPVVASHTGVRAVADSIRNLSDDQLRGIAGTGGLVGIGFWPTACGGDGADWIARSITHAIDVAGIEHVALGSDWDGAVPVPFDATGIVEVTDALLRAGLGEAEVAAVMGGNVVRLLLETLPGS